MTSRPSAHRGQAAPELIGIVVVIALMTAALAAALPRMRMPDHPPRLLDVAASPFAPQQRVLQDATVERAWRDAVGDPTRGSLLGRRVRMVGGAFAGGSRERLNEIRVAFRDDPLGTISQIAKDAISDPTTARYWIRRAKDLPGYVREFEGLSLDASLDKLAHDLGREAVDVGIQLVTHRAALRAGRAAVRRGARPRGGETSTSRPTGTTSGAP